MQQHCLTPDNNLDQHRARQDISALDPQTTRTDHDCSEKERAVRAEGALRYPQFTAHPHQTPFRHQQPLALAWIDYATAKSAKMESAAKRKAASAAMGDGDGRPAKRQKVPVRAVPNRVEGIVGGGSQLVGAVERCRSRCGMAPGWSATTGFDK